MRLLLLSAAFVLAASAAKADVGMYPHEPFDATFYTQSTAAGQGLARHISDGRGHLRIEIEQGGNQQIGIVDYINDITTELIPSKQLAARTPVTPKQCMDELSVQKDGTPIGAQVVDGHPCHGYKRQQGMITSIIWIGDDTHYMVHSDTYFQKDKSTFALKDWSADQPSPDLFVIPPNYQVFNMPVPSAGSR